MNFYKCLLVIIEKHLSAIIIALAIIIAAIIYAYLNPYQSCKRDIKNVYEDSKGQALSYLVYENCGK